MGSKLLKRFLQLSHFPNNSTLTFFQFKILVYVKGT